MFALVAGVAVADAGTPSERPQARELRQTANPAQAARAATETVEEKPVISNVSATYSSGSR
jgi:hypothetical protein